MRVALLWAVWLVVGCGDDGVSVPVDAPITFDAEDDFGAADPVLVPCPTGWREDATTEGTPVCDPWPATGRADCMGAEAHLPGTPGCAAVGAACPPGEFPDDLPADATVVYVSGSASGGDGSRADPYGRLSAAGPRSALPDTVIVLGRGEHDGLAEIGTGVTVRGACAGQTRLFTSITTTTSPVVRLAGADAAVSDLTVSDVPVPGLGVLAGAAGRLSGLVVERTGASAVFVQTGATLDAEDFVVREPSPVAGSPSADTFAVGGTATVRRASFERATIWSVLSVGSEASLELADAVVRDTGGRAIGARTPSAINITEQGSAALHRVAVEDSSTIGLQVTLDARATLSDVAIHRVAAEPGGIGGTAMWVASGAVTEAGRVDIAGGRDVAVLVNAGGVATFTDTVVRGTRGNALDAAFGYGIQLVGPADLAADRLLLEDNRGAGLGLFLPQARADVRDLSVVGTLAQECADAGCSDNPAGHALLVRGGEATVRSFRLDRSNLCGVLLSDTGQVDLHEGVIAHGEIGVCLQVDGYDLSRLQDRVRFEDNLTNLDATTLPVPDPSPPPTV